MTEFLQRVGGEIIVNSATCSSQHEPQIAVLDGVGFVVTWQDLSQQNDDSSASVGTRVFTVSASDSLVGTASMDASAAATAFVVRGNGISSDAGVITQNCAIAVTPDISSVDETEPAATVVDDRIVVHFGAHFSTA